MGLPGPQAQNNAEVDQLLIRSVLKASEFYKKHRVNSKGLNKEFFVTGQQAKKIMKRCPTCPTCSFYNQILLPGRVTQRDEICQMDVFHFADFWKLKICAPHH